MNILFVVNFVVLMLNLLLFLSFVLKGKKYKKELYARIDEEFINIMEERLVEK